jgi:hypothetical protein
MAGRVVVYLFVLGVVAVVSIGLVLAARRAERRSELSRWARATKCLNDICPPVVDTATVWCRVVDAVDSSPAPAVAADLVASLGAATPREIPAQPEMTARESGADAA